MPELFNALRYVVRYGIASRAIPNDLPSWSAVCQRTQRWLGAECSEALAREWRAVLRLAAGCKEEPAAAIIDRRTLRPTSGCRFFGFEIDAQHYQTAVKRLAELAAAA